MLTFFLGSMRATQNRNVSMLFQKVAWHVEHARQQQFWVCIFSVTSK